MIKEIVNDSMHLFTPDVNGEPTFGDVAWAERPLQATVKQPDVAAHSERRMPYVGRQPGLEIGDNWRIGEQTQVVVDSFHPANPLPTYTMAAERIHG